MRGSCFVFIRSKDQKEREMRKMEKKSGFFSFAGYIQLRIDCIFHGDTLFPQNWSTSLLSSSPFSLCSTAAGRWRIGIVCRADGILYIIPNAMYYTHEIFRIVQIILLLLLLLLFLPIKTPWSEGRTPQWHLHVSLYLVYYKISYFWRNEPALWIIFALLRVTQSTLIQFRPTVARSLSLPPSPTRRLLCMQMEEGGREGR